MRTKLKVALVTIITSALAMSSVVAQAVPLENEYIVVLKDGVKATDLPAISTSDVEDKYSAVFNGYLLTLTDAQVNDITEDSRVRSVAYNAPLSLLDDNNTVYENVPSWGLDRIDQRSSDLNKTYTYTSNQGEGVYVYVIDSGVYSTHPEFTGRILQGVNKSDDVATNPTADDCYGHGTHVAGTAAGSTIGIAKKATVVPVKVIACSGNGRLANLVDGLDWIYKNHPEGTKGVINMSLGWAMTSSMVYSFDPAEALIKALKDKGVYSVDAAGNASFDACSAQTTVMPAASVNTITAGATDNLDARAYFSNFGKCVDIFAPGVEIYSSMMNGGYGLKSGTSMASPHVAGAVAVMLGENPSLSFEDVKAKLASNATTLTATNLGAGSPAKLLYMQGDMHVISTEFNYAYDEVSVSKIQVAGGNENYTFTSTEGDGYSLSADGTITTTALNDVASYTIPVSVTDGNLSASKTITYNLRTRPTVNSATYTYQRDGFLQGTRVYKNVTASADTVKIIQDSPINTPYAYAAYNDGTKQITYLRRADDSQLTWRDDITLYGIDKYGIKSKPATIRFDFVCNLLPDKKNYNFVGEVGKLATIDPVTLLCGTPVTEISVMSDNSGLFDNVTYRAGVNPFTFSAIPRVEGNFSGTILIRNGTYQSKIMLNMTFSAPAPVVVEPTPEPTTPAVEPTPEPTTPAVEPTPEPTTPAVEPTPEPTTPAVEPTPEPTTPAVEPTPEPEPIVKNPLVDINVGQLTVGEEIRVRLSDYFDLSQYKNLTILNATSSIANLLSDEVVLFADKRGLVEVRFQAEYLDGTVTNIASITGNAVPPYAIRVFNLVNDTKVGDTLNYELGFLDSVTSLQWYSCTVKGEEVQTTGIPTGCSVISRATTPNFVLTASQLGKYVRLRVVSSSGTFFSVGSERVYGAPGTVSSFKASAGKASITATWKSALANFAEITEYRVRVFSSTGGVIKTLYVPSNTVKLVLNATNASIVKAKKYKVEVTAYNKAGAGKSVLSGWVTTK